MRSGGASAVKLEVRYMPSRDQLEIKWPLTIAEPARRAQCQTESMLLIVSQLEIATGGRRPPVVNRTRVHRIIVNQAII